MGYTSEKTAIAALLLLMSVAAVPTVRAAAPRNMPYIEFEGVAEKFRHIDHWRHYYWREDIILTVRDDKGKRHQVISREPTPWSGYRLGTTHTGIKVDWSGKPRVWVIGLAAIDRIPVRFHDEKIDPKKTITALILRVWTGKSGPWRDVYINNWFHRWGDQTNLKMLPHYAVKDPNYTVYGYLAGIVAPMDAAGKALIEKYSPIYQGIIHHSRIVPARNKVGYERKVLHLLGRHRENRRYEVFYGDPSKLVPLDGRRPRMTDVTASTGIKIAKNTGVGGTNPHAVAVADFDADGDPDLLITTFRAPHVRYFRNEGKLRFKDITKGSGLESFQGAGTGAAVADFDRDGKLDVYLSSLRGGASRLYKGKGDGTFIDVSDKARALHKGPGRSCAWSDVDADGWVDLYVTCPGGANRLFRNNRNGTFTDIAASAGTALAKRHSLGCAFGDVDGDGLDDLFVANYHSQEDNLLKNLGGGKFRDVTAASGITRKASSVGCVFGDVSGTGKLDLYVTTDSWLSGENATEAQLLKRGRTVEPNLLYANDGKGRFKAAPAKILRHKTLSHDAILEDLDHDGRLDIYVAVDAIPSGNRFATHKGGNPLWTRDAKGNWREERRVWGVGHEGNCVSVPAVDLDGDGDLDLVLVNFYSNVVVYRNDTNGRSWLRVKAVGTKSNPDGIGAKIRVYAQDGSKRKLIGLREIQSGTGYCRCSPLEVHFGLGKKPAKQYRVEVYFPATKKRVIKENVAPGRRIVISEE